MTVSLFHPAVSTWFRRAFDAPTEAQQKAWPAILAARDVLIAAPTGSGKTLPELLGAIDDLVKRGVAGSLTEETTVVYVSPLKALSNDVRRNLEIPLAGIRAALREHGLPDVNIRTLVRTGDTPQAERQSMGRRPPHIVITTPESLYVMLGSDSGRRVLATTRTVIVDEIHAVVGSKRGSHLALSLERLEALAARPLVRIGLSATQNPIEDVARFLVGARRAKSGCEIVDAGHARHRDLQIEVLPSPLEAVMSGEVWQQLYDRLAELIASHRTTLVFVNTRRLAERVTHQLSERLGADKVTSHHGSLSAQLRLDAENRLKDGRLRRCRHGIARARHRHRGRNLVPDRIKPLDCDFLQRASRAGRALSGTPGRALSTVARRARGSSALSTQSGVASSTASSSVTTAPTCWRSSRSRSRGARMEERSRSGSRRRSPPRPDALS
jgi:ATP-dependent Lhr-like helicase